MKTKLFFLALIFSSFAVTAQFEDFFYHWENQDAISIEGWGSTDVNVVNSDVVWLHHYNFNTDPATNLQNFSVTADGGTTWTEGSIDIGSPGSGIAMIHGISATTAWAVAYPNAAGDAQGIYKTTDGGTTWNKQTSALYDSTTSFSNVVYFWDENHGICQGDPVDGYYEIYLTDNGGDNWTRVPQADLPDPIPTEFGYTGQIYVTGDTVWWTTSFGRIYRNFNKGVGAWEVFQSVIDDFGGARVSGTSGEISFNDDQHGYLINNTGLFYTTTNGGETWDFSFPQGRLFSGAISAIPGTNALVSTGSSADAGFGSSYSVDGGVNFTTIYEGTFGVLDVDFKSIYVGYAGSFKAAASADPETPERGGVFKWISTIMSTPEEQELTGFAAFPNPVQDVLHMGAKDIITDVNVVNMLGQEVFSAKPSTISYELNMSNLPNGTYIVNATINGITISSKIIK